MTRREVLRIGSMGWAAPLVGAEEWQPFRPIQDSTLRVVSDPRAYATLNHKFTWELEWRPEQSVLPGVQIELRSLSLRTYHSWGYCGIEADRADVIFRRRQQVPPGELFTLRGRWVIARLRLQYELHAGDPLRIRLTAVSPHVAGLYDAVSIWIAPPVVGAQQDSGERTFTKDPRAEALLQVGPGTVEWLGVYSRPMHGPDGTVRTVLSPEDRFGNPAEFRNSVPLELEWSGKNWTERVKGRKIVKLPAPSNVGRLRVTVPAKALAVGENVANGQRARGFLVVTGNPVWAQAPGGLRAGFGEFHWHTEASADGGRSLEDGLLSARDHMNMDWVAPGDHTPRPGQWRHAVALLEQFNRADDFATFFGYEHSGNRGHENFYFTNPNHAVSPPRGLVRSTDRAVLGQQLDQYNTPEDRFMAIPHHTNAESETRRLADDTPYWFPYNWTKPASFHRNVEVFQTRGNQERNDYPDDSWRGWYANKASVQDALAHGYKLGFTGGTDNHTALPGRAFAGAEMYGRAPTGSVALTGVWTRRIERGAVFGAIYQRHTWAVWDTRALVYFTVNGAMAGDDVDLARGAQITARIKMSAEDALRSIEVVSDGKAIWSGISEELDFDITAPLGRAERSTYFYVRAKQRDGGIIYASPVFVTVKG